jgi:hypothetical protein
MITDTFPEFEVDDFNRLKIDQIPAHRVSAYIDHCLTDKEFRDLTMNHYGSYILGASKNLLWRSGELLTQLGALEDFIDPPTAQPIDWAELKRQERANNLRIWWEKKGQRKELMRSLPKLYPKGAGTQTDIQETKVISELASVFSPQGQQRQDFNEQLQEITAAGFGSLLPWRHIIIKQVLDGTDTFSSLKPVIKDNKNDTALRFQFLTELCHHQHIDIDQKDPFGEIRITPKGDFNRYVTVKDERGNQMAIDWFNISETKRNLALVYMKEGKILLSSENM